MTMPQELENERTFSEESPRDWVRQVGADCRRVEEVSLVLLDPEGVHKMQHRFAKVSFLGLCK